MNVLKFLRTEHNFTHKHVALITDLTSAEVSLIETGRLRPTSQQLEKLAKAFRVSRPEILLEPARLIDEQRATVVVEVLA